MVHEYLSSPLSQGSTYGSSNSLAASEQESIQKYKRISSEKRKLLLDKIFFENKKIKKAAKELNLNYSSAKTILHLYRKKIRKPKHDDASKEIKRCNFDFVKSRPIISNFEIVATQGGKNLNELFFNKMQKNQKIPIQAKQHQRKFSENEGKSFVEQFLLLKEIERKLSSSSLPEKSLMEEELKNKSEKKEFQSKGSCFRKAIVIKPIDPSYAHQK